MLSLVVTGRNDGYGGEFHERLLRTARANAERLRARRVAFELLLVEWNPVADRPLAAEALVAAIPEARAIVVGAALHDAYSLNPAMAFHEMAAKNVGIRHARGETIVVGNADVIFDECVVEWLASAAPAPRTLYRAARIDVVSGCPLNALHDPRYRLRSGEGTHPTCSYLGAGGDFCAARRDVWHALGGFDERNRFTTRAKDWQFFLSARACGVAVQYVGAVYHLDHGEGFRNTPAAVRDSGAAHFGAAWDFEFELPVAAPAEWGVADALLREDAVLPRVLHVDAPEAPARWHSTREHDADVWNWLRASQQDPTRAALMHAIAEAASAQRPLAVVPRDARAAVAACGLASIAREQDVDVRVRWEWPDWYEVPSQAILACSASVAPEAWTALVHHAGVELTDERGMVVPVPPSRSYSHGAFNPLLARRLLRAWLQMLRAGWRRIAIYGAGSHTESLLSMGVPAWLDVAAIVVSSAERDKKSHKAPNGVRAVQRGGPLSDPASAGLFPRNRSAAPRLPIMAIDELPRGAVDGILLSSVTFEGDMRRSAEAAGWSVLPLYADDAHNALRPTAPHAKVSA